MINEIKKSIRHTITELKGTISLGKYTLVIKLALLISEPLASVNVLAKNCQGRVPAHTKRILGMPVGTGILKKLPITVIIIMVSKGLIMLQAIPITVCL
jgi:hypothetical protein